MKQEQENKWKKLRAQLFGAPLDEMSLAIIEERFGCGLPCFQKQEGGGFDPMDAMRRDAYREVTLWLRYQLKQYRKETNNE